MVCLFPRFFRSGDSEQKSEIMDASKDALSYPAENVSLTLNLKATPDSMRRRYRVTEKKFSSETLKRGGTNEDTTAANVNEVHYNIKDQSLLERPRRIEEMKRGLVTVPLGSRRKKGMPKPEKPQWQTFLSVLTKCCLLVASILWLGSLVWRLADIVKHGRNFSVVDGEDKLSDAEASFKSIAKMLQVQLDVVNKKIGTEVGITRRELKKQMDEKHLLFEEELKRLVSKTNRLDESLEELKSMELLSKEELHNFLNEIKQRRLGGSNGEGLFDNIRNLAKEIVEMEIEKHAADGLGRVDYALASGGARVISHSEPYLIGKSIRWLSLGKGCGRVHSSAQKMLEPSFGEPGQCFALQGSNGFVEIRLRTGIVPEAVTLEHVSKSVAFDRSSAPKDCTVSAWSDEPGRDSSSRSEKIILTEFSYDLEKSNAQTFEVETTISGVINLVRLEFSSNHGSSSHTCIYRFRVHGHEPNSMNVAAQG